MASINRIRLERKGLESLLGPLEADILKILWTKDEARVREVYNLLKNKRKVALTSVAVTLDRLYEKKLVKRDVESGKGGTHYIYSTRTSKGDFESSVIENTVNKLIDNFGNVAVNYFNERFAKKKVN
jgi:predicted transcriptional regulator